MLEMVGLTAEAESAYEALLNNGQATLGELASAAGLTMPKARAVLRVLENHGLITGGRTPGSYTAVDPGIALDVLLLEREEQIKRARVWALELSDRFHQAVAGRDPTNLVEIISGRQAVVQRIDQMQRSARREIRCFDTPPYAGNAIVANNAEQELLSRGGIARVIYDRAAVGLPGRIADLEEGVGWGEQARVLPKLPMKMLLIDDRIGAVPLEASPTAIESTILVYPSGLLEGLSALFETLWQLALPLELSPAEPAPDPPDQPSPGERRILALLTAGLPDESIARQLGISDRTYQRRIHDLMQRLHVQSRFQLARQAVRRGWLSDHDAAARDGEAAEPRRTRLVEISRDLRARGFSPARASSADHPQRRDSSAQRPPSRRPGRETARRPAAPATPLPERPQTA